MMGSDRLSSKILNKHNNDGRTRSRPGVEVFPDLAPAARVRGRSLQGLVGLAIDSGAPFGATMWGLLLGPPCETAGLCPGSPFWLPGSGDREKSISRKSLFDPWGWGRVLSNFAP